MHFDSSISIIELMVAIPMDASSKLSDVAYSANSKCRLSGKSSYLPHTPIVGRPFIPKS